MQETWHLTGPVLEISKLSDRHFNGVIFQGFQWEFEPFSAKSARIPGESRAFRTEPNFWKTGFHETWRTDWHAACVYGESSFHDSNCFPDREIHHVTHDSTHNCFDVYFPLCPTKYSRFLANLQKEQQGPSSVAKNVFATTPITNTKTDFPFNGQVEQFQ